jgi:membrane protein GlpM
VNLALKAIVGAAVVVLIAVLSRTRNFYIAGLVPLFPTFALVAHYIVGTERSAADLRTTIAFGMWSIIPYFAYLAALYALAGRMRIVPALMSATLVWLVVATALVFVWSRR